MEPLAREAASEGLFREALFAGDPLLPWLLLNSLRAAAEDMEEAATIASDSLSLVSLEFKLLLWLLNLCWTVAEFGLIK